MQFFQPHMKTVVIVGDFKLFLNNLLMSFNSVWIENILKVGWIFMVTLVGFSINAQRFGIVCYFSKLYQSLYFGGGSFPGSSRIPSEDFVSVSTESELRGTIKNHPKIAITK